MLRRFFHEEFVAALKTGFKLDCKPASVRRTLQKACAGGSLSLPFAERIEKVLDASLSHEIKNCVRGLSRPEANSPSVVSGKSQALPRGFMERLRTEAQREAARQQIKRHRLPDDLLGTASGARVALCAGLHDCA